MKFRDLVLDIVENGYINLEFSGKIQVGNIILGIISIEMVYFFIRVFILCEFILFEYVLLFMRWNEVRKE